MIMKEKLQQPQVHHAFPSKFCNIKIKRLPIPDNCQWPKSVKSLTRILLTAEVAAVAVAVGRNHLVHLVPRAWAGSCRIRRPDCVGTTVLVTASSTCRRRRCSRSRTTVACCTPERWSLLAFDRRNLLRNLPFDWSHRIRRAPCCNPCLAYKKNMTVIKSVAILIHFCIRKICFPGF